MKYFFYKKGSALLVFSTCFNFHGELDNIVPVVYKAGILNFASPNQF